MVHAKFQDHGTSDSEEEGFLRFGHIWAWQPSWSCDQDHFYKNMSPPAQGGSTYSLALIGQAVSEKMF